MDLRDFQVCLEEMEDSDGDAMDIRAHLITGATVEGAFAFMEDPDPVGIVMFNKAGKTAIPFASIIAISCDRENGTLR